MADVDPFEIEFDDEPPKRPHVVSDRILSDVKKKTGKKKDPVPELDTQIVDLPKENENEKAIIVDNNPPDATRVEPVLEEPNPELDNFDESQVIDPPEDDEYLETKVSPEEVGFEPTIFPDDDKDKEENPDNTQGSETSPAEKSADSTATSTTESEEKKSSEEKKKEPSEKTENKQEEDSLEKITEEEVIKEAEALAQHSMPGFIPPPNWDNMTLKEKMEVIKNYENANKPPEDHSTYEDNKTTNNFEGYKRYPTGLRLFEDALGIGKTGLETAEKVANKNLGGMSVSDAVENSKAVPHYDYTSLFGRR